MSWTDEHAPKVGARIRVRPIGQEEYNELVFEVLEVEEVPAAQLDDCMPWQTWWNVRTRCTVPCPNDCCQVDGDGLSDLLLAANSFVEVGR